MTDSPVTDKQAWIRRLVQQYQTPLIRYAQSIVRDEHIARDIAQETFLKLCQQTHGDIATYEPAWLFRVCHNLAINRQRKEKRMTTQNSTLQSMAAGVDPANDAVIAEDSDQVTSLIDDLPEDQQRVIRLKFYSGLKYREIGEATGLSEGNVGYLLHTAVGTLREQMRLLGNET